MVNLSVGLGYLHHGLKRQAENRQYLIMQGLSSVLQYARASSQPSTLCPEDREVRFTVARALHMLGLHHLAYDGYSSALASPVLAGPGTHGDIDTLTAAAFNRYILLITGGDLRIVEILIQTRLIL